MLAHLVRVIANIIAGDGDCSASRFEGKPSGRVGSVRRTYEIETDVNFCYNSDTLAWKNDKQS